MTVLDNKERIEELLKPLEDKIEHYHVSMDKYIKKLHGIKDYIRRYDEVDKEMNGSPTPLYEGKDYIVKIDKVSDNKMAKYIELDSDIFDYILIFENCSRTTMLMIDIDEQTFFDNAASKETLLELLEFDVEKAIINKLEKFKEEYL